MNRGGNRGGRGGGMYNNMGGRGGGPGQGGSFRGHGNRGFGNRDNRRGGSFNTGAGQNFPHGNQSQQQSQQQQPHHNQQNFSGSFRGRNQNYANSHARGGRHDSVAAHKDSSVSSAVSSGKKEENRRTLTDFKIVGLELQDLAWSWGTVPKTSGSSGVNEGLNDSNVSLSAEASESQSAEQKLVVESNAGTEGPADTADATIAASDQSTVSDTVTVKTDNGSLPPPPSRIRIYFHTPVTADDAHALSSQPSLSHGSASESSVRKGKRKKLEDDDGDIEDGRGPPPPPPQHSGFDHEDASASVSHDFEESDTGAGRDNVSLSVAETASEGDWLMAAIGEDETEGGDGDHHSHEIGDIDAEGEPDDYDGKRPFARMIIQCVDVALPIVTVLTANFRFVSKGNDYDEVEAQMEMVDSEPHHLSNPAHDSGSVPPGLSHDSSHEPSGPPLAVANGGTDTDAPPPIVASTVAAPLSSDAEAFSPAHSATEPGIPVIETMTQLADANGSSSAQTNENTNSSAGPSALQAASSVSTVPDTDAQAMEPQDPPPATQPADDHETHPHEIPFEPTQLLEHPPDARDSERPPSSETSSATLSSPLPPVRSGEEPSQHIKFDTDSHVPSANRLSISYAAGTRRMVIDSGVVEKLKVFRSGARIEVYMTISEENGHLKGILVSLYQTASSMYYIYRLRRWKAQQRDLPPIRL